MFFPPASLEVWMRQYYHTAVHDLGSSGVQEYGFGQLREILDIGWPSLGELTFNDSTSYGLAALRDVISIRWGNGSVDSVMLMRGSSEAIYTAMSVRRPDADLHISCRSERADIGTDDYIRT